MLIKTNRSVHNTRIERAWVDYKVNLGQKWVEFFFELEMSHGLDTDNLDHLWLLHYVFLPALNADIERYVEMWNSHLPRHDGERSRSPLDRYHWDMQVYGIPGDRSEAGQLSSLARTNLFRLFMPSIIADQQQAREDVIASGELASYGVDWEALDEPTVIESNFQNNPITEDPTPWMELAGMPPPERMNTVTVDEPSCHLRSVDIETLGALIYPFAQIVEMPTRTRVWDLALEFARSRSAYF